MSNAAHAAQLKFQVSRGDDSSLGPFTVDEIAGLMAKGELSATDYAFDENVRDWVPLFELHALKERLRAKKPKLKPASYAVEIPEASQLETMQALNPEDGVAEWFLQKGPHQYGPFSFAGVVRALQEKTVYEFDLVCQVGSNHWVRLAEHPRFSHDEIRKFQLQTSTDAKAAFIQRRHPRIHFENEVIVHDNRSAWLGHTVEMSQGGSCLVIDNPNLKPGQSVQLHFAGHSDLPSFNVACEIISKRFSKKSREPLAYNVRFTQIEPSIENKIVAFVSTQLKQKDKHV